MSEEQDTWPPRVGQAVWIEPAGGYGTVVELRPDDRFMVKRWSESGSPPPGAAEWLGMGEAEEYALSALRPKGPHLAPERQPEDQYRTGRLWAVPREPENASQ